LDFGNRQRVRITLFQGWNRQVRRMFEKVGYEVSGLRRCGFGSLNLRGLKVGAWRRLLPLEVARLKSVVSANGN
jgi:23S rRNA pseudouridine2605 synthase